MREDYRDKLDEMFPDGWAIGYTNPDGQIRFGKFNPHGDKTIQLLEKFAKAIQED